MATPVDTSVKWAHSSHAGAPVVNGTAGSRITALRAFLVSGFGTKAVDSAVVSGGKCRLNFASGASAADLGSVIQVTGATPTALNGEQKVTLFSSSWVEFATALPDGAVTGSVSFKIAPLGWDEIFSKTNVSVFRPTDPASTRPYLRVDDTNALYAAVTMYETMTDVDTGFNATTVGYWAGRSAASATAVTWALLGDSRGFYVGFSPYAASANDATRPLHMRYFGDIKSDRSGDSYCGLLTRSETNTPANTTGNIFFPSPVGHSIMRVASGTGGASETSIDAASGTLAGLSGTPGTWGVYPSRAANALLLTEVIVADGGTTSATGRRGVLPGLLYCPQSGAVGVLPTGTAIGQIAGTGSFLGKRILAVPLNTSPSSLPNGVGFFDTTGPWR